MKNPKDSSQELKYLSRTCGLNMILPRIVITAQGSHEIARYMSIIIAFGAPYQSKKKTSFFFLYYFTDTTSDGKPKK